MTIKYKPPASYHRQDGCWNCKHAFDNSNHDMPDYYLCVKNAPPPPPVLDPSYGGHDDFIKWESEVDSVKAEGTCDEREDAK